MEKQVAILIDGDNISPKYAEYIKQEAITYGKIKVFRLYGSISASTTQAWYGVMPEQGIAPMLQLSYANGKSIADQALTIDAMDLLYAAGLDVFCIASSDSDYVKLVYRLREAGKLVIGMGERKTNEALAKACDEFKILDLIYKNVADSGQEPREAENPAADAKKDAGAAKGSAPAAEDDDAEINIPDKSEILDAIDDYIAAFDEERINLSEIGQFLKKKYPGFDARNYAYRNMTNMLEDNRGRFFVLKETAEDGVHKVNYVSRVKKKTASRGKRRQTDAGK